jgi:hypothetical protein
METNLVLAKILGRFAQIPLELHVPSVARNAREGLKGVRTASGEMVDGRTAPGGRGSVRRCKRF